MLFLVISESRPKPFLAACRVKSIHAHVCCGAVMLFNAKSAQTVVAAQRNATPPT